MGLVRRLFGFVPGEPRILKLTVRQWVWLLAVVSVVVQVILAEMEEMQFRQGGQDLGIMIQAFSNTGGGRVFWTTNAVGHFGGVSLLEVHFAWPLFAVYPAYAFFPSEFTLFVIQAAVLAVAAIPLEALGSTVSGSKKLGFLAAGLYLVWAPLYAGMPSSFHLEAFLPVSFFAFVLAWWQQRYVLGLCLALVAAFTLDVSPVFTALIGTMFLTYPIGTVIRASLRHDTPTAPRSRLRRFGAWSRRFARLVPGFFRLRDVQACLALVAVSVGAFFALRYLELDFPTLTGLGGSALNPVRVTGFSFSNISYNFDSKAEFWVLMLATVGFLPLLYPRILILLGPWVGYTFCVVNPGWYSIDSHYVAIAAVPLFLGTAFGIRTLRPLNRLGTSWPETPPSPRVPESLLYPAPALAVTVAVGTGVGESPATSADSRAAVGREGAGPASDAPARDRVPRRPRFPERHPRASVALCVAVVAVIAAGNLVLNPLDFGVSPEVASTLGPLVGGTGGPYGLTPTSAPGLTWVENLAHLVPKDGMLLVANDIYPIVASDPNAYPYWSYAEPQYLPFNNVTLPDYVLSYWSYLSNFDNYVTNLSSKVWEPSHYGDLGWVETTRLGSIFLFQLGYTGATQTFGPIVYPTQRFQAGSSLVTGPSGTLANVTSGGQTVPVVTSNGSANGSVWRANSRESLPAGQYDLTVDMQVTSPNGCASIANDPTVLRFVGSIPSEPVNWKFTLNYDDFQTFGGCGSFVSVSTTLVLSAPTAEYEISALRSPSPPKGPNFTIDVSSVTLSPLST